MFDVGKFVRRIVGRPMPCNLWALCLLLVVSSCLCGWFVETMWAQLSNLEPLDYLPGTTIQEGQCRLTQCQNHCRAEGEQAQGTDLNQDVVSTESHFAPEVIWMERVIYCRLRKR